MRRLFACLAVFLGAALAADQVLAQADSRSSNSAARTSASNPSMFSNSNARRGSSTGGASAMGRSGGAMGRSGGMNNMMGQNGQMQLGDGGSTSGSERFMRGNRQAGNFVGSDLNEVSQFFSNLTGGRAGTGGQNNFGPQSNNRGNDFNAQNQQQTSNIMPHRLVVAFPTGRTLTGSTPAISAVTSRAITLRALGRLPSPAPLNVELQNRTAILRGVVATDHDRVLAEKLTLLEPGIDRVQNLLTVAEALPPGRTAVSSE